MGRIWPIRHTLMRHARGLVEAPIALRLRLPSTIFALALCVMRTTALGGLVRTAGLTYLPPTGRLSAFWPAVPLAPIALDADEYDLVATRADHAPVAVHGELLTTVDVILHRRRSSAVARIDERETIARTRFSANMRGLRRSPTTHLYRATAFQEKRHNGHNYQARHTIREIPPGGRNPSTVPSHHPRPWSRH